MKKGFTILELLVASLLLGMLMTILTMIFNQSSIAWRIGLSQEQNMGTVRSNIASLREESDNAFVHGNEFHRIIGLWDSTGNLRQRACDADNEDKPENNPGYLVNMDQAPSPGNLKPRDFKTVNVGRTKDAGNGKNNYIVNVKSDGPDGKPNTWDDVWSFPDQWD